MSIKFFVIRFSAAVSLVNFCFASCDDDISDVGTSTLIGSEIITKQESDFTINSGQIDINQPRTNNLDYYLLGNNNHGLGNTNYSILTQINSVSEIVQDSFIEGTDDDEQDENGDDVVISNVIVKYELIDASLVIPFRYEVVDSDDDDYDDDSSTSQYNIKSNITGELLTLNIYESKYLLQTNNPNDLNNSTQKYYGDGSDGSNELPVELLKGELLISYEYTLPSPDDDPFTVDLFLDEDDIGETDTVNEEGDEYSNEGVSDQFEAIRIPLNDTDFKNRLISLITSDEDINENGINDDLDLSIVTEDEFTSSFKGLYIEAITPEGGIIEILPSSTSGESFVNAGIQLTFKRTVTDNDFDDDDDDDSNTPVEDDFEETIEENIISTLQFSSNPINILTPEEASQELPTAESNTDDIILQSGLGRLGTIDLFSDDELSTWRENNILLNDAVLELTVNTGSDFFISEDDLPDTLFITELDTGNLLLDYSTNFSSDDDDNETLKEGHLISIRDEDEDGIGEIIKSEDGEIVYKINITEHLANILQQDNDEDSIEENITLAISATEDLNVTSVSDLYSTTEEQFINQGSLLCFKTIPLYGSSYGSDDDEDDLSKRPRLIIKYTETK